jgi:hypothetical protein
MAPENAGSSGPDVWRFSSLVRTGYFVKCAIPLRGMAIKNVSHSCHVLVRNVDQERFAFLSFTGYWLERWLKPLPVTDQ